MSESAPAALITRPRDDAGALAFELSQRGYRPLLDPLLQIRFRPHPPLSRAGVQGLLFTSANGARALADHLGDQLPAWCDLPVWAVGDSSAGTARQLGFERVASADGDVAGLADLVAAHADPAAGRLLHCAASQLAGDLSGRLTERRFGIDKVVLYDSVPARSLSAETIGALQDGAIAEALFFSPRTAESFVRLATAAQIEPLCRTVRALALSPAVAAALDALAWRRIAVAARPVQSALLAILDGG